MRISIRRSVLLVSIFILTAIAASAQKSNDSGTFRWASTEFGATNKAERAYVVPSSCGCFWMQ